MEKAVTSQSKEKRRVWPVNKNGKRKGSTNVEEREAKSMARK
jgi:hypothetical protein